MAARLGTRYRSLGGGLVKQGQGRASPCLVCGPAGLFANVREPLRGFTALRSRKLQFPPDTFSRTIAQKVNEPMFLVAVERVDGVVQTPLGILVQMGRE